MDLSFCRSEIVRNAYSMGRDYYYNLYTVEGKSTRDIAKLLQISQPSVRRILVNYNIPQRTYKDNKMPNQKGVPLPPAWRKAISEGNKGVCRINPKTGRGFNCKKEEVNCSYCNKILLRAKKQTSL